MSFDEQRQPSASLNQDENVNHDDSRGDMSERKESPEESPREPSKIVTRSQRTMWDISVFRDFFLAAFSDGYQNACVCGDDLSTCCDVAKKRIADDSTLRSARSTNSHDTYTLSPASQDTRRRRKKPLAVAVGFKYAEDPSGRPIVVTPTGSRSSPIDVVDAQSAMRPPPPPIPHLRSGSPASMPPAPLRPRPGDVSVAPFESSLSVN